MLTSHASPDEKSQRGHEKTQAPRAPALFSRFAQPQGGLGMGDVAISWVNYGEFFGKGVRKKRVGLSCQQSVEALVCVPDQRRIDQMSGFGRADGTSSSRFLHVCSIGQISNLLASSDVSWQAVVR